MTAANDNPLTQLRAIQARIDQLRKEIRTKKVAVHILYQLYDEIEQELATNTEVERKLVRV